MSSYSDKLKDPRWQKKRLYILERDNWRCKNCGDAESTLVVHHRNYLKNTEPWDYPDNLLVTLCELCHSMERETRSNYEGMLLSVLRERFLADEIYKLVDVLLHLDSFNSSDLICAAINFATADRETQLKFIDHFKR